MKVWLVTNRKLCHGSFLETVEEAARAGLEAIILREKDLCPADLFALAVQVKIIAGNYGVKLLVGGSVEVALATGAAGVHLGKEALPPAVVRERLGYQGLVGVSAHNVPQALAAAAAGADYLLIGHIFDTGSKPGVKPRGPGLLTAVKQGCELPLVAIGGIGPDNVEQLYRQGIENVAVMSHIMASPDPYRAVRQLHRRCGQA